MTLSSLTRLMDQQVWTGKIFTGEWIAPTGGEYQSTEPSTGDTLGVVGRASVDDVLRSAVRAAEAQKAWAAAPFDQRARVLRRAGQLWEENAADIQQWIIRESGSTVPKAGFELHVAANECYEAAALASRSYGQLLQTEAPRLSLARRLPAGVVSVIAPFNAPLILSIRSIAPALALGNAVLLKPDPRTAVCGGVALASGTEYGLSLGILTGDVMKGLELAERIPSGIVHINDQTINDEAVAPFGGVGASGTGSRLGGSDWNIDAFTETQWVTLRRQIAPYPM